MNILMITDNDPAGMGIAFTKAINFYSDHKCRLITKSTKYCFDYETDIHIPDIKPDIKPDTKNDCFDEVEDLLENADIFHFHILSDENIKIGPFLVRDFIKGKKIIHHHHGHPDFRSNPNKYIKKYKKLKRQVIVSSPDLLQLFPEAIWQPNIVPLFDKFYLPYTRKKHENVYLCHCPTRKELKNTNEFKTVVNQLLQKYPNLHEFTIENTPHNVCLSLKQKCDIAFDHMQGYFGVSSLESLSQGKPVLAGVDNWNQKHIKKFTKSSDIPWVIVNNQNELHAKLEQLIIDIDLRKEVGNKSRGFMEKSWNEKKVLKNLFKVYNVL